MQQVRQIVQEKPDRFVLEIAEEVERRLGVAVRRQTVGRWLVELGLTRKKSVHAQEQQHPDVKEQREQWMQKLTGACDGDFSRVLFLDETGAMTNLVRSHGRSDQGERCIAFAPNGHWKILTAVAAIRFDGLTASATVACPMDGRNQYFQIYVREGCCTAQCCQRRCGRDG